MFKPKAITVTAPITIPTINSLAVMRVRLMQIVGRVHQGRIFKHGNKHFAQVIKTLVHLKHKHKHCHALLTIQGQLHKLEQKYAQQVYGLIG
jgi:hypothetical protein